MKTFKQYIQEALDKPFAYKKLRMTKTGLGDSHEYGFKDDNGERTHVFISHYNSEEKNHPMHNPKHASVDFTDSAGNFEATGQGSIRHLSTVKAIMQQHAKDHPELKSYGFSAEKDRDKKGGGGRSRLYSRLAKMAGGITTDHEHSSKHWIPINRDKNGD